jgi:hypothetical protein
MLTVQTKIHNPWDTGRPETGVAQQPPPPRAGSEDIEAGESLLRANDRQEGGAHYKQFRYETWDVILDWGLGYLDGNAVKYLSRWRHKNGIEDLKKARHYIDKLLETEMEKHNGTDPEPTANRVA